MRILRLRKARIQPDGGIDQRQCLFGALPARLQPGVQEVQSYKIRVDRQRALNRLHRLIHAPLPLECGDQVDQRRQVVGVLAQDGTQRLLGLVVQTVLQEKPRPLETDVQVDHLLGVGSLGHVAKRTAAHGEIAEATQALGRCRIELERHFALGRAHRGTELIELALHVVSDAGLALELVGQLARVAAEIVQLRRGGIDQLPSVAAQQTQLCPAVGVERQIGFPVDVSGSSPADTAQKRYQAVAGEGGISLQVKRVDDGGDEIDLTDHLCHASSTSCAGQLHDPRDVQGRIVGEDRMGLLAVLAEALAVVGEHHHPRAARARRVADAPEVVRAARPCRRSHHRTSDRDTGRGTASAASTPRADHRSAPTGRRVRQLRCFPARRPRRQRSPRPDGRVPCADGAPRPPERSSSYTSNP